MKFIFFSGFLWLLAIFHLWDHRRFERDIRLYMNGQRDGDWRIVDGDDSSIFIVKRAFKISSRADIVRYATPVVFLFLWLVIFRFWSPACAYVLVIAIKWFVVETLIDTSARTYTLRLLGQSLFSARVD